MESSFISETSNTHSESTTSAHSLCTTTTSSSTTSAHNNTTTTVPPLPDTTTTTPQQVTPTTNHNNNGFSPSRHRHVESVATTPLTLNNILLKIAQNCSNVNNTSEMKIQHLLDVISCLDISQSSNGLYGESKWVRKESLTRKLLFIEGIIAMDSVVSDNENPLNCIAIDSEIIEVLILTFKSYKKLRKSLEPLIDCTQFLSTSLGSSISYHQLVLMFSVVDRLKTCSLEEKQELHGGSLRGNMWSFFNVLCDMANHVLLLSKSKCEIKLGKNVDPITVKIEGELRTQSGTTFLLLEEIKHLPNVSSNRNSISVTGNVDDDEDWENISTLKMILSMKSLLRRNLYKKQNEKFNYNSSTVMGVSYSKQLIHLFVMRGFPISNSDMSSIEEENDNIPIKLYYKRYKMVSEADLLILCMDILNFSNKFRTSGGVETSQQTLKKSKELSESIGQNFSLSYWNLKPFIDSRSDEDDILFKIQNQLKKLCLVPTMAINKKIISEANNEIGYSCKTQNTTFVKRIEQEERYVISKLLESRETSRCLPQVVNLYNSFVEYEELIPLPSRLLEGDLIELCLDVCHALDSLHYHNIIHRDVKIQNVMLRKQDVLNSKQRRYVLIDFSMSFHFEKTDNGNYIDTFTMAYSNENYGTNSYKAPEVVSGGDCFYDERIDVFSLGASILCCLDRKKFVCSKKEGLQKMVDSLEWTSMKFQHVIRLMVDMDPTRRPSPQQVIRELLNQTTDSDGGDYSTDTETVVGHPSTTDITTSQNECFPRNQPEVQEQMSLPTVITETSADQVVLTENVVVELEEDEPPRLVEMKGSSSKRDSDSDDSDDSLSPIYSARSPYFERSDFFDEFDS